MLPAVILLAEATVVFPVTDNDESFFDSCVPISALMVTVVAVIISSCAPLIGESAENEIVPLVPEEDKVVSPLNVTSPVYA